MMPNAGLWPLACPVCNSALALAGAALRCDGGHAFDRSREGYVNLLPSSRPLPPGAGDAPEMLAARRAFLEAGHYALLAELLSAKAIAHLAEGTERRGDKPIIVLDSGCGEGYYGGTVRAAIERCLPAVEIRGFGTDIAKSAIRMAARRHHRTLFAVADSTRRLPFLDGSIDLLLDVFAPRSAAEFARVVRPGGMLICVIPAADHLESLREAVPLLDIEQNKAEHVCARLDAAFALEGSEQLRFELSLDNDALRLLATMMPGYRHFGARYRQVLSALGSVKTAAAFTLLRFERRIGGLTNDDARA